MMGKITGKPDQFHGKNHGFRLRFSQQNQSNDTKLPDYIIILPYYMMGYYICIYIYIIIIPYYIKSFQLARHARHAVSL